MISGKATQEKLKKKKERRKTKRKFKVNAGNMPVQKTGGGVHEELSIGVSWEGGNMVLGLRY